MDGKGAERTKYQNFPAENEKSKAIFQLLAKPGCFVVFFSHLSQFRSIYLIVCAGHCCSGRRRLVLLAVFCTISESDRIENSKCVEHFNLCWPEEQMDKAVYDTHYVESASDNGNQRKDQQEHMKRI